MRSVAAAVPRVLGARRSRLSARHPVPSFFHAPDFLLAFSNPDADNAAPYRCARPARCRRLCAARGRREVKVTRSAQMLEALLKSPPFRTIFPRSAAVRARAAAVRDEGRSRTARSWFLDEAGRSASWLDKQARCFPSLLCSFLARALCLSPLQLLCRMFSSQLHTYACVACFVSTPNTTATACSSRRAWTQRLCFQATVP